MNFRRIRKILAGQINTVRRTVAIFVYRLSKRPIIHFIHIGKTGGSAIKVALEDHPDTPTGILILHRHRTRLREIPSGEKVFFFVRDPIARFISAFYSRQVESRPRYYRPWSRDEKIAFSRFSTVNELGRALSSADDQLRKAAEHAMNSIVHVSTSIAYWLESETYLRSRLDDIILIGSQETLGADFEALKKLLQLPADVILPNDEAVAHRGRTNVDKNLDDEARQNLRTWYRQDYELLEACNKIRNEMNSVKSI
jgi:hypothetical protein